VSHNFTLASNLIHEKNPLYGIGKSQCYIDKLQCYIGKPQWYIDKPQLCYGNPKLNSKSIIISITKLHDIVRHKELTKVNTTPVYEVQTKDKSQHNTQTKVNTVLLVSTYALFVQRTADYM